MWGSGGNAFDSGRFCKCNQQPAGNWNDNERNAYHSVLVQGDVVINEFAGRG
jgi:hypothetical protein